jgi:glyoxylase-like metal-dependent hydrolase (beta-lactamase superfamily II)
MSAPHELIEVGEGVLGMPLRTPTLPPATHTNTWIIGHDELVVVEPASPWPDEQARLDAVIDDLQAAGRRVREIWLTHHHGDHIGGAPHLAGRLGVPIAAHLRTAQRLEGIVRVDRVIGPGQLESLGQQRWRALYTPGHAPGHLCFFEERSRTMIAGDMVAGVGFIVVDPDEDGDMTLYLDSLRRLRAESPAYLLPAHGPVMDGDAALAKLDEYVTHRLAREAKVFDGLVRAARAVTRAELLPIVYADVDPRMHFVADRSLAAHLDKLVKDGRAAQAGDRYLALGPPA